MIKADYIARARLFIKWNIISVWGLNNVCIIIWALFTVCYKGNCELRHKDYTVLILHWLMTRFRHFVIIYLLVEYSPPAYEYFYNERVTLTIDIQHNVMFCFHYSIIIIIIIIIISSLSAKF